MLAFFFIVVYFIEHSSSISSLVNNLLQTPLCSYSFPCDRDILATLLSVPDGDESCGHPQNAHALGLGDVGAVVV